MPTIELSSALASRASSACLTVGASGRNLDYQSTPIICNTTDLYLCSGVKPATTPTLTQLNTNKLVLWYHQADLSPTTLTGNTVVVNTNPVAATASGTATWFCICTAYGGVALQSITGTVGLVGSGSDLEIVNTAITSGTQYRVSSFILTLPTSWTY